MMDAVEQPINESLRREFELAWIDARPRPIEDFLPGECADDPSCVATLEELVHIELEFAWKAWANSPETGSRPNAPPARVEQYLDRFPQLNSPEIVQRLVEQEFLVRNEYGDRPEIEEFRCRFPSLESINLLLETIVARRLSDTGRSPAGTMADTDHALASGSRRKALGGYELLGEIGRGGMGVVYRARQVSADRVVAVKVIRREQLSLLPHGSKSNVIERFHHEALAAARLEHDHIVTVYEVGEVDGDPFFSMRYVDGSSLAEVLRAGPLENRRAARYLEPVARAVHEAHEKGVLHRDIKPQNILIDRKTDHALVADFGLAKLVEADNELTRAGDVMGTPAYMAPEQARDSAGVQRQTDVYSLGATLYHMLAGRPPFQSAKPVETIRQVIDDLPVPPSRLNRAVARDLETICLKCLEKDPARRYATALDLADDLCRYEQGLPIVARPVGRVGIAVRWCRRNPALAASLTLAVAFFFAAFIATAIGYRSTRAALDEKSLALEQRERSYRQAREVVNQFSKTVSEDLLLDQPGMKPLRRQLLELALPHYERFLAERGSDPDLVEEIADTQYRVGLIYKDLGQFEKAERALEKAKQLQQELLAETDSPAQRTALGDTWNATGRLFSDAGRHEEALEAFEQSMTIRQSLARRQPAEAEYQRKLANAHMNNGVVYQRLGQIGKAIAAFEASLEIRRKILDDPQMPHDDPHWQRLRRDNAIGCFNLANLLKARDRGQAVTLFENAAATFLDLLEREPGDLQIRFYLGRAYSLMATLPHERKDYAAAAELYTQAIDELAALAASNPREVAFRERLAATYCNLGILRQEQNDYPGAEKSLRAAVELLEDLPALTERTSARGLYELATEQLARLDGSGSNTREERAVAPE